MTYHDRFLTQEATRQVVDGYKDLVITRIDAGWDAYVASVMFHRLGGSPAGVKARMAASIERLYARSLNALYRHPRKVVEQPLWLLCPDYPVPKAQKASLREVSLNDGLHYGGTIVVPPGHRLDVDFGTHVLNRQDLYTGGDTGVRRFLCKPITKTPRKAVRYGLKALERGRATLDDLLLLPRSRAELGR